MYKWNYKSLLLGFVCLGLIVYQTECRAHHHVKHKHTTEYVSSEAEGVKHPAKQVNHKEAAPSADEGITYHGIIHEDAKEGDEVELDQPITAHNRGNLEGDLICGYTVYKWDTVPFKVVLTNKDEGKAKVVVADSSKLSSLHEYMYKFEIAPHDCVTGQHAPRDHVHIAVEPAKQKKPTPHRHTFVVEVVEGKVYDEIVKLDTADSWDDCQYEMLTPGIPFKVDEYGIVTNTEPLDHSKAHNYILQVRVTCAKSEPERVTISIKIKEVCKPGWKGVDERIEYPPTSDIKLIAENAKLELCKPECHENTVTTKVHLATRHIGKGCDRDTYSIQSQRKLCGASSGSVDLLPSPAVSSLTKDLETDDGNEADQIFYFDGQSHAVEIPATKFNHTLSEHFTISTWMKHEPSTEHDKHRKEHVICNADGNGMSRHHYSLFIHNCKLVFLMRQEPDGGDLDIFKPAEWRWKLPEVCDGQWHHYAVSVDFPQVRLYIDGRLFVNGKNNPDVVDDWPLHPTTRVSFTKLVVGGCWQGGSRHLGQYFRGYMAGLSVLKGKTESDRVIKCLNNCKEKLDFHDMSELDTGMSMAFNTEMTDITINGHNHTEIERLVRKIGYINYRVFPTPGHRALTIKTDVTCQDGSTVKVPDIDSMVLVLQPEKPIITLSGTQNLARGEHDLIRGEKLFFDLTIVSRTRKEEEEESQLDEGKMKDNQVVDDPGVVLDKEKYHLDSCVIHVDDPPLAAETEHFQFPEMMLKQLGLQASQTRAGLLITGADKIYNYQNVLRHVRYINRQPEGMNHREFLISCSELNGRFISNDLKVKLDFVHTLPHQTPEHQIVAEKQQGGGAHSSHLQKSEVGVDAAVAQAGTTAAAGGIGMTLIVVVCVGFLVFMIVLGIIRIRAAHQKAQVVHVDDKQEMEWDNSALNIIVNPMDTEVGLTNMYEEEHELNTLPVDSDSDSDDGSSFHDDLESSEEEEPEKEVKGRELEWDDSTLTF